MIPCSKPLWSFVQGLPAFCCSEDFRPRKDHYYRHVPTGVVLHVKDDAKKIKVGDEFEDMDKDWVPSDTIIKTVCRILIPFIQIYALYVVAHGDFFSGRRVPGRGLFSAPA